MLNRYIYIHACLKLLFMKNVRLYIEVCMDVSKYTRTERVDVLISPFSVSFDSRYPAKTCSALWAHIFGFQNLLV